MWKSRLPQPLDIGGSETTAENRELWSTVFFLAGKMHGRFSAALHVCVTEAKFRRQEEPGHFNSTR